SMLKVALFAKKKIDRMAKYFSSLDVFTTFISALCHDVEHPGLTNAYHINSQSDLALRYNDQSVLENHHAHIAALLMKKPNCDILSGLTSEQRKKFRKTMISTILQTDMSVHQSIVAKFQNFLRQSEEFLGDDCKQFLVESLVHLGDLSNPVMDWPMSFEWARRVIQEFYHQSLREKYQGLPVAGMEDKQPQSVSKVQTGFIDFIVTPLWKSACTLVPELDDRFEILQVNRQNWVEYGETAMCPPPVSKQC
ncbi:3'5'-cyclic nucleotide phosphodiesterase family protein, partial [Reticulomyxa filosa]